MAKIMNTVQEETAVDSLRPYTDAEIPAAMKRMANDPTLGEMVAFAFPGIPLEAVREKLLQVRSYNPPFQNYNDFSGYFKVFPWKNDKNRRWKRASKLKLDAL